MATAGGTYVPDSWVVENEQGNYVRQPGILPTKDMSAMWGGNGGGTTTTPAPTASPTGTPADYTGQAGQLYTDILGREGDAEGMEFWADQLAQGKSLADVTNSFKDSARTVLDKYLTGGTSPYASLLDQDLKTGTKAGGFDDGMYQNALAGLDENVFTNLYGARTTTGPGAVGTKGTATAAQAPQFTNIGPEREATPWNVTRDQTSAYQLEQIIKSDSPLMQLARTRALQDMARSGTQNSSMAATAGEVAMIDRAQPFALNDAGTYADAARFTADAQNQFARDANAFGREQTMANFNVSANDWASDRSLGRQLTLSEAEHERQLERDRLDYGYDRGLVELENETGSGSQQSTLERGYINAINQARSDYANALANISSSKDMDSALKAETLANLQTTYNTMIKNYAQLLGWDPASWIITTSADGDGTGGGGGDGDGGGGSAGAGFSPSINGVAVDWNTPNPLYKRSLRDDYNQYKAQGGLMTPREWWIAQQSGADGGSGPGNV